MEVPFVIWTDVLKKEIFIYSKLIPMYRELQKDAGVAENDLIDCVPKYMGHRYTMKKDGKEVDDQSLLLMENIKVLGYYICDRKKSLDFHHATLALTALARYHALGVVLAQKRPHDFEKAKRETATLGFVADEFEKGYDSLLQTFEEGPRFAKHLPKIRAAFATVKKGKLISGAKEPWITIIHGDFWTNNLLFHKNDYGEIDSVKFVDFQMCLYSSPCRDLAYFLFCSFDQELFDRLDELLELYFKKFTDTLRCIGCDTAVFTRRSFDEDFKNQTSLGFPMFVLCIKYFTYEVSEEEEKDREILKSVLRSKCSELCKEKYTRLCEMYEERGWFQSL
ncbi:uncharacterized protein LOC116417577 [Nasonia vitripennis]|uniref:CHK kinase-like domain-containing protein n=1 Tax=Nasonia vitripennis TaxID=7425 RepID=A0A7M7QIH8_NASVI|nr:uncharacterized protein LOC116417577 [Nasonia vitripennis]